MRITLKAFLFVGTFAALLYVSQHAGSLRMNRSLLAKRPTMDLNVVLTSASGFTGSSGSLDQAV